MWEIALPLVYINLFGAAIYVLLCGQQDCHRGTFIERWNAFLLGGCFESLADVCGNVFGKKILYLACVLGPFIFFIVTSWHHLGGPYAPAYHKYLSFVFVGAVVAVYFNVCRSDPGRITPATLPLFKDNYPYDHMLYEEKFCKTCQLPRPARSMHCRICNTCVSRFDHHCVWINNCVGERNQKKFIAFLFATSGLCFYGFLVASGVVAGIVEKEGILHYVMKNRATGEITPISYPTMFVIIIFEAGPSVMVAFFSLIMGIVLFLFALYHVHLVYSNTTTSETFKWGDLKHDVVVAKDLLKKIDKDKKRNTKNKNKKQKQSSKKQVKTDTEESDEEEESEEEKKRNAKEGDPRFKSELYRHRKALTYSMHKRLSQRVKMDHMGWFAYKADQLDRQMQEQKQRHDQAQSSKPHQKQQQTKKDHGGATEEERRYEEMTEEKLNRAFLQELRWLADELEVDNIYNRGWRSNFAEVLDPISERKMAAGLRTKKRK